MQQPCKIYKYLTFFNIFIKVFDGIDFKEVIFMDMQSDIIPFAVSDPTEFHQVMIIFPFPLCAPLV
jgi:hypothetical protein